MLKPRVPLLMKAKCRSRKRARGCRCKKRGRLEGLGERQVAAARIRMKLEIRALNDLVDRLQDIFVTFPGRNPVVFDIVRPDGTIAEMETDRRVKVSAELLTAIRDACGAQAIDMVA